MDDHERELARKLYDLHLELFTQQGEEIAALRQAIAALARSHDTLGEVFKIVGQLVRPS
jgi:hypothetical protein